MGKKTRQQVQKPLLTRRNFLKAAAVAGAGLLGYGALSYFGREEEKELSAEEVQSLVDRFSQLNKEKQNEALKIIFDRCDKETEFDILCDMIIKTANPTIVKSGLTSNIRARYGGVLDVIYVYENCNNKLLFKDFLLNRGTYNTIIAHECLHKIQNNNNPDTQLVRTLRQNGKLSPLPEESTFELKIDQEMINMVRSYYGKQDMPTDQVLSCISDIVGDTLTSRRLAFLHEVSARFLTPIVKLNELGAYVVATRQDFFDGSRYFNQNDFNTAMTSITHIYGFYSLFSDVDVKVNMFVGSVRSIEELTDKVIGSNISDSSYYEKGIDFLKARSKQLDKVPHIAKEVLEDYL